MSGCVNSSTLIQKVIQDSELLHDDEDLSKEEVISDFFQTNPLFSNENLKILSDFYNPDSKLKNHVFGLGPLKLVPTSDFDWAPSSGS